MLVDLYTWWCWCHTKLPTLKCKSGIDRFFLRLYHQILVHLVPLDLNVLDPISRIAIPFVSYIALSFSHRVINNKFSAALTLFLLFLSTITRLLDVIVIYFKYCLLLFYIYMYSILYHGSVGSGANWKCIYEIARIESPIGLDYNGIRLFFLCLIDASCHFTIYWRDRRPEREREREMKNE